MIALLVLVALLFVLGGGAAIVNGAEIILTERGWTQVIAGSVALTGGALLFGLALVLRELRAVRREAHEARAAAGAEAPPVAPPAPLAASAPLAPPAVRPAPPADPEPAPLLRATLDEAAPASPVPDAAPAPEATPAPEPRTVTHTYSSNGTTYVMFSDGSIELEGERGRMRFRSMAELKRYIETGEGGEPVAEAPA